MAEPAPTRAAWDERRRREANAVVDALRERSRIAGWFTAEQVAAEVARRGEAVPLARVEEVLEGDARVREERRYRVR